MDRQNIAAAVSANIARYGWHCQMVFPVQGQPGTPFAYTVGLMERYEHPELLVSGLPSEIAHQVLALAVEAIQGGKFFMHGDRSDRIARGYEVAFRTIPVNHSSYPLGMANLHYGRRDYTALQIVFQDAGHRYPWDPECSPTFQKTQDVITTDAPWAALGDG